MRKVIMKSVVLPWFLVLIAAVPLAGASDAPKGGEAGCPGSKVDVQQQKDSRDCCAARLCC
jgi:hypothetical protein